MASALKTAQAKFVVGVSKETGIDPRVLVAWVVQEGAYAPGGTGAFNFLNLRPYEGDPYSAVSSGNFEQFSNVSSAIAATVRRLKQPFAAPIIAAVGKSPSEQIAAIAGTGWDADHYGGMGGINLKHRFASIFSTAGLTDKAMSAADASGIAGAAGSGSAGDAGSFDAKDAATAAKAAAAAAKKAAEKLNPFTQWTGWITDHAAYGSVYLLLVLFGMFLLALGVLSMLGIKPSTVATTLAKNPELAAA